MIKRNKRRLKFEVPKGMLNSLLIVSKEFIPIKTNEPNAQAVKNCPVFLVLTITL